MAVVTGGLVLHPIYTMAAIRRMTGLVPATTLYEYAGSSLVSSGTFVSVKSWTVASDGAVLQAYRIDPNPGYGNGYLKVEINGNIVAAHVSLATYNTLNYLVGMPFADNHPNNVDQVFAKNGDVVTLYARRSTSNFYADWIYFEYDLN